MSRLPLASLVLLAYWVVVIFPSSSPDSTDQHTEPSPRGKKILLLKPRSFCAGVVRAIATVEIALETFGAPVYVRREIVHNKHVVQELSQKGAIFVQEVDEVPAGERVIFSAHGVSPAVRQRSRERKHKVIDATCPLVTKVHIEAVRFAKQGNSLVLIGHRNHDEIEGTLGEAPEHIQVVANVQEVEALQVPDPQRVAYLTQTTLSLDDARTIIDALKQKYPAIIGPRSQDICYASENRQLAVRSVAKRAELVLVVGSANSSNSNRLVEVARSQGALSYLVDTFNGIIPASLVGISTVAVTAGASAPEVLVEGVIDYLRQNGFDSLEEDEAVVETVHFNLPSELTRAVNESNRAQPAGVPVISRCGAQGLSLARIGTDYAGRNTLGKIGTARTRSAAG